MYEVITGQLWIGHAIVARDIRRLLNLGVAALIDLAIEELPPPLTRELIYLRIPLTDGSGNSLEQLSLAIETCAQLIQRRIPSLIFCGAGMSRSPAIAAAAWSLVGRRPADEVLQQIIRGQPHDVSPALWQDVREATQTMPIPND